MQSKNILKFKILLYFILVLILIFRFITNNYNSKYSGLETKITGYVKSINFNNSKLEILLIAKEKILVNYYVDTIKEKQNILSNIKLGDYITVSGVLSEAPKNSNFNMFNYKEYLKRNNIYYIMKSKSINKVKDNTNILYNLKQKVIDRINNLKYSKSYVYSFIMGDTNYISDEELEDYRNIGISHLFAISGMHISLIIMLLSKLLIKTNKYIRFTITSIFLLLYLFIIDFSITALRACLFTFLLYVNKNTIKIFKSIEIVIIVFLLLVIYNPNNIYNMGLQISIIVSFFLVLFSKNINNKTNKLKKLLNISYISFISTLPIMIYYFNTVNILSIFINILFVPLVSYILFPLCIVTFILPIFDYILYFLFNLFYLLSNNLNNINFLKLSFSNMNVFICIIYYLVLLMYYKNKHALYIFIIMLFIHYNIIYFNSNMYIYFFDVGQGDSMLIMFPHNKGNILIDTGGKNNYCTSELGCSTYSLGEKLIIPSLKKLGIKHLDYLILTHGDYDHMGEAINLVENFKVEKVIFNCGEFNELEQELIKVLNKKKIPYYSCIKKLNIYDNKLYFLNNKDYGNENDNSSVVYTELNKYKFLFVGDAGVEVEEDLIEKYNLQDIDILKVGHHGSKTSSSKNFIDGINPKYSVVSVGKNNRYGHPNNTVLDTLSYSKIYRTDQDGSVEVKINKKGYIITTCIPQKGKI